MTEIITMKRLNYITTFDQYELESLYKAWERYKDCLMKCPYHGLPVWMQMKIFYNGLQPTTRTMIDEAAGGYLMSKSEEEAYELVEEMAANNYQWHMGMNCQWRSPFANNSWEEAMNQSMPAVDAKFQEHEVAFENNNNTLRNIERMVGQLVEYMTKRPQESLPPIAENRNSTCTTHAAKFLNKGDDKTTTNQDHHIVQNREETGAEAMNAELLELENVMEEEMLEYQLTKIWSKEDEAASEQAEKSAATDEDTTTANQNNIVARTGESKAAETPWQEAEIQDQLVEKMVSKNRSQQTVEALKAKNIEFQPAESKYKGKRSKTESHDEKKASPPYLTKPQLRRRWCGCWSFLDP